MKKKKKKSRRIGRGDSVDSLIMGSEPVWKDADKLTPEEYDDNPALKGGQKKLPDELQASIIKKSVKEELDYEGEMAKSELLNIIKNAEELFNSLYT